MSIELNTLAPKKWVNNYSGTTPSIDASNGVNIGDYAIDSSNNHIWRCADATISAPVWIPITDIVNSVAGTGLMSGGIVSVNTSSGSITFDVSAGHGFVTDQTNPDNQVIKLVTWNNYSNVAATYRTTDIRSNIMIDSNGAVHQSNTVVSFTDSRDYIILARLLHSNKSTISSTVNIPRVLYDTAYNGDDLSQALGSINISGNFYSYSGPNLNISKTSGQSYRTGANYINSKKLPNITSEVESNPVSFQYRYRDGLGGYKVSSSTTSIDPDNYDDGSGTLQTVGNNEWTVQRIYMFPGAGTTYVTYGQVRYATFSAAKESIQSEAPDIDPYLTTEASLRSFLVIKKGTTNLSDTSINSFIPTGKFGEPMVGGTGGGDVVGPLTSIDNSLARFDGTSGNTIQDGANIVATDAGYIGIGTTSPIGTLDVRTSVVGDPSVGFAYFTKAGDDIYASSIVGRKSRGTLVSPSNVAAGDRLMTYGGRGYGTTGYPTGVQASTGLMVIGASEAFTDTANGTYISFITTPNGSSYTGRQERMKIDHDGTITIGGNLSVSGNIIGKSNVVAITTSYSATTVDEIILANTSSNTITVTLPTAIGNKGKEYIIKNIGASNTNAVTVTTSLSQTIDGITSQSYNYPSSMTVVSDNANWWII
jgi:hypothetical protein